MIEHGERESLSYRASPYVRGVELLSAERTSRPWRFFCETYALALSRDWAASMQYRGRALDYGPGLVFCGLPGEVAATKRVIDAGGFDVLAIARETFEDHIAEHLSCRRELVWRGDLVSASPNVSRALVRWNDTIAGSLSPLEIQSELVELMAVIATELLETSSEVARVGNVDARWLARVRERLHDDEAWTDLATLADEARLSRFQVLRAFKRHYGLSPHDYQVGVRVMKARKLLRSSKLSAAEVALECGFADQSHFIRCFKRIVGTTPRSYVRALGL